MFNIGTIISVSLSNYTVFCAVIISYFNVVEPSNSSVFTQPVVYTHRLNIRNSAKNEKRYFKVSKYVFVIFVRHRVTHVVKKISRVEYPSNVMFVT